MAAIFIESDNVRSLQLITAMAEQSGISVNKLSKPETETIHSKMLVKKEKNDKKAGHKRRNNEDIVISDNSANVFLNLRKRIKAKMTNGQIDEQIKSLRKEWRRDI